MSTCGTAFAILDAQQLLPLHICAFRQIGLWHGECVMQRELREAPYRSKPVRNIDVAMNLLWPGLRAVGRGVGDAGRA